MKEGDILLVKWLDTVQASQWQDKNELDKRPDADCYTVGFYYKEDDEFLYLSHCVSRTERDKTTIPLGCIIKRIKVKYDIKPTTRHKRSSEGKTKKRKSQTSERKHNVKRNNKRAKR